MAIIEINKQPSRRDLLTFGAILAVLVVGIGAWLRFKTDNPTAAAWVWGVGGAVVLAYLLIKPIQRPLYLGWIYAFFPIGWVLSHIVLGVIYYLVLTPIGLIMRALGKDPMNRKMDPAATTYWVKRAAAPEASRYLRQF